MKNQRKRMKRKRRNLLPTAVLFSFIAVLLLFSGVYLFLTKDNSQSTAAYEGLHHEEAAVKMRKPLSFSQNKENDFSYEMKTDLTFKEGSAKIELKNPHCNKYLMYTEIAIKGEDEVIASCDLILPGEKLPKIELSEDLKKGKYEAYANICAVDPETEEFIGFLVQDLHIEVKD